MRPGMFGGGTDIMGMGMGMPLPGMLPSPFAGVPGMPLPFVMAPNGMPGPFGPFGSLAGAGDDGDGGKRSRDREGSDDSEARGDSDADERREERREERKEDFEDVRDAKRARREWEEEERDDDAGAGATRMRWLGCVRVDGRTDGRTATERWQMAGWDGWVGGREACFDGLRGRWKAAQWWVITFTPSRCMLEVRAIARRRGLSPACLAVEAGWRRSGARRRTALGAK
jgi:hypothetical protein